MARKFAIDTLARGGDDKEDETPRQIYGKKLEFVYVFGYDHQDHAHKTDAFSSSDGKEKIILGQDLEDQLK